MLWTGLIDLEGIWGGTKNEVGSGEKSEQKESPPKFCANHWSFMVVYYLLKIIGYGINQGFSIEKLKLAMFSYENRRH